MDNQNQKITTSYDPLMGRPPAPPLQNANSTPQMTNQSSVPSGYLSGLSNAMSSGVGMLNPAFGIAAQAGKAMWNRFSPFSKISSDIKTIQNPNTNTGVGGGVSNNAQINPNLLSGTGYTPNPNTNTGVPQGYQYNDIFANYGQPTAQRDYTNPFSTFAVPEDYWNRWENYANMYDSYAKEDRQMYMDLLNQTRAQNQEYAQGRTSEYAKLLEDTQAKQTTDAMRSTRSQISTLTNEMKALQGRAGGALTGVSNSRQMAAADALYGARLSGLATTLAMQTGDLNTAMQFSEGAARNLWEPKLQAVQNAQNYINSIQGVYGTDMQNQLARQSQYMGELGTQYGRAYEDQVQARDMLTNIMYQYPNIAKNPTTMAALNQMLQNPNLSTGMLLSSPLAQYIRPNTAYQSMEGAQGFMTGQAMGEMVGSAEALAVVDNTLRMAGMVGQDNRQLSDLSPQEMGVLLDAITRHEGGTPQGTNNPSNIKFVGQAGATRGKRDDITNDDSYFANFESKEAHDRAAIGILQNYAKQGLSVAQGISNWKGYGINLGGQSSSGSVNFQLQKIAARNPSGAKWISDTSPAVGGSDDNAKRVQAIQFAVPHLETLLGIIQAYDQGNVRALNDIQTKLGLQLNSDFASAYNSVVNASLPDINSAIGDKTNSRASLDEAAKIFGGGANYSGALNALAPLMSNMESNLSNILSQGKQAHKLSDADLYQFFITPELSQALYSVRNRLSNIKQ